MEKVQHIPSPPAPAPAPAPAPPESPSVDIEMGFAAPTEPAKLNTLASASLSRQHHIYPEWLALIMGFCFTAIGIGLQCQDSVHLSISLHTARLGLVFALSAFVVSKYIPPNLGAHAQVLEYAGVFCGVTAFFLAITGLQLVETSAGALITIETLATWKIFWGLSWDAVICSIGMLLYFSGYFLASA